jgi:hypothetical protein
VITKTLEIGRAPPEELTPNLSTMEFANRIEALRLEELRSFHVVMS